MIGIDIGFGLCMYFISHTLVIGRIDPECNCAATMASNVIGFPTYYSIDSHSIDIIYNGDAEAIITIDGSKPRKVNEQGEDYKCDCEKVS